MHEEPDEFEPLGEPLQHLQLSFHLAPEFEGFKDAPLAEMETCHAPIESHLLKYTPNLPLLGGLAGLRRFSVAEYHKLIEIGMLTENDRVELLEGYLVRRMPRSARHDGTMDRVKEAVPRVLPTGWLLRVQQAITLSESEPEPDFAAVRGNARSFLTRHPLSSETGLAIEVADLTLARDRADKGR